MRMLILMRGLPGSGKSTEAQQLAIKHVQAGGSSVAICSTDSYHMVDGKYVFQEDKLGLYHTLNQNRVYRHMELDTELIIVDNTNIKRRDMRHYLVSAEKFGYEVEEITVGPHLEIMSPDAREAYLDMCARRNQHDVPRHVIAKMAEQFQE